MNNRRFVSRIAMCTLLGSGALAGCGSTDDTQQKPVSGAVEIFSWWVSAGEKDALDAMLTIFKKKDPDTTVINAAQAGNLDAVALLERRLTEGDPPDTFQATAGNDLMRWVTRGTSSSSTSIMEPLDSIAAEQGWTVNFRDAVNSTLSFDGHVYGVPVNTERDNTMYYNMKIFSDNQLTPPTTLSDLFTVCDALKAKGITPIALGANQFWGRGVMMWYGTLLAGAGPDYFMDFFAGKKSPNDPEIRTALNDLSRLLDCANADADQKTWDGAADMVFRGEAAMTMVGDWVKGYLSSKGWQPDVDFGEMANPGTGDVFVFASDSFGLPLGAVNRDAAVDLLKTFGSPEAQTAFSIIKGSAPARTDVELTAFDAMTQRRITDLKEKKVIPIVDAFVPGDAMTAIQMSLNDFAKDRNVDNEIRQLNNRYASLAK
jgi:glucose/mannose transport system substrate-binding protein